MVADTLELDEVAAARLHAQVEKNAALEQEQEETVEESIAAWMEGIFSDDEIAVLVVAHGETERVAPDADFMSALKAADAEGKDLVGVLTTLANFGAKHLDHNGGFLIDPTRCN